jgi:alpha-glucan,water dikinase
MGGLADFLFWRRNDHALSVVEVLSRTFEARRWVHRKLKDEKDCRRARDLLFLDLGLEEFSRVAVERKDSSRIDKEDMVELVGLVLENIRLSRDDLELSLVSRHWGRLRKTTPRFSPDWALHAKSVLDRLGRGLGSFIDRYYLLFQSKAEYLGNAFQAEPWSVNLFTEEVARGRLPFVLSMLLRRLDPWLRNAASLGDWQVISPGSGAGRVEVVEHLRSVQGMSFDGPRVIMANKVGGDEEIPREVTAVITPDSTDIVSHVAVRARNARQLFATCYDPEKFQNLKSLSGRFLRLEVNAAGDVVAKEDVEGGASSAPVQKKIVLAPFTAPKLPSCAVSMERFREGLVGGKSNTLRILRERLPESVGLPLSMALPFGVFEKVLAHPMNKDVAKKYEGFIHAKDAGSTENLTHIRNTVLQIKSPDDLESAIRKQMEETGLDCPKDLARAWERITHVWASKWNERAYLSRKSMGIPHGDLFMAVLIQQVVESEYAFVVHSANPFSGDIKELYAEVVLGLGETLVGNYPGRALSFVTPKDVPKPRLLAFPGKSHGLYGKGLIFRSDSNGEDLAGYAGAGLYDSVLLEPPCEKGLDYSEERLVWDVNFRNELLTGITKIGALVEKAMGGVPQDIEGAYAKGKFYVVQTRSQAGAG